MWKTLLNLIAGLDKAYTGSISFGKNKAVHNLNKLSCFKLPDFNMANVQQNVEVVLNKNQNKNEISKFLSIMGLRNF